MITDGKKWNYLAIEGDEDFYYLHCFHLYRSPGDQYQNFAKSEAT